MTRDPSTKPPVALAESLAFLLSQVGARTASSFGEALQPLGLTPRAFGVLSHAASGGPWTQQQLADALGMHRNVMVGVVDDLEAAGWVRRHRSASDRRAFEIRLTTAGARLVDRAHRLLPSLEDDLAAGLGIAERRDLVRMLTRVAANLDLVPGVHPHLRT